MSYENGFALDFILISRMVVLGIGWAGISFLKDLDISTYDVQIVSPRNWLKLVYISDRNL